MDASFLLAGKEILVFQNITANACTLLMGLTDTLNLTNSLRYTFGVFQKLYLELGGMKMSPKVNASELKLLSHHLIAIGSTAQSQLLVYPDSLLHLENGIVDTVGSFAASVFKKQLMLPYSVLLSKCQCC